MDKCKPIAIAVQEAGGMEDGNRLKLCRQSAMSSIVRDIRIHSIFTSTQFESEGPTHHATTRLKLTSESCLTNRENESSQGGREYLLQGPENGKFMDSPGVSDCCSKSRSADQVFLLILWR